MEDPRELRKLADWYRQFAERAGNPAIWEARLSTAKDLERKADHLEKVAARGQVSSRNGAVEQHRGSID
jgi:phosphate uptake regulator